MSELDNTRCEFTKEIEKAAIGARNKAAADWDCPLAPIYAQVALELRRILERHARQCPICLAEDGQSDVDQVRHGDKSPFQPLTVSLHSTVGVNR